MACKKDKTVSPVLPQVSTLSITNIAGTTATGGGNINSNGGADVTLSGLCYSTTNQTPTIANDTTKSTVTNGNFTSLLKNLQPSSTYYVRAYAVNSVGVGYGEIVSFTTGNGAPIATSITIAGTIRVTEKLTATYTYSDAENDPESGSTFQWYRANDAAGNGLTAIAGATTLTYTLQAIDEFKYICAGITAKTSSGNLNGTEVKSNFSGPVAEPATTITFSYNGQTVTYGIITSAVTGRRWLDRNLGAANTPQSYSDWANYGDLFQFGRSADGHQIVTRTGPNDANVTGRASTTTPSSSDKPGHALLINNTDQQNWRIPSNDEMWNGLNSVNNPCPAGFRLPLNVEWQAENLTSLTTAYTQLKITASGEWSPGAGSGIYQNAGYQGLYWTAYINPTTGTARFFNIQESGGFIQSSAKQPARSCRCIKD